MAILRMTDVSDQSREAPGYWDKRVADYWEQPMHGLFIDRTRLDVMDARNLEVIGGLIENRWNRDRVTRVLECACGYGRYFSKLEGVQCTGIDIAARNVEEAFRVNQSLGTFHVGDMANYQTADRFDVIFMVAAMSSIESRSQEIADHLKTLLAPGGCIAIFEEDSYMVIDRAWHQ